MDGMAGSEGSPDASSLARKRLSEARDALLALHKALVEAERGSYEQTVGTIQSPNHFLKLLTTDPWFAWLHPISRLIVTMDEQLEAVEPPLTSEAADTLLRETRGLLMPSEAGQGFGRHYFEALQEEPDVVLAHAAVIKIVGRKKPA